MRGASRPWLWVTATAVTAALLVAPAAGLAKVHVRVSPGRASPAGAISITLRNPAATGRIGSTLRIERVRVSAVVRQRGCVSARTATLPSAPAGAVLRVRLRPGQHGAVWCAGPYRGAIVETLARPCRPQGRCREVVLGTTTLGRFSFRVRSSSASGGGGPGPAFGGLASATACLAVTDRPPTGGPPLSEQFVTLTWSPASDPMTPSSQIVYEIFYSSTPGGEDFSSPTWTSAPGATSERVVVDSPAPAYFVVRARDNSGLVDRNTVERKAVLGCAAGG